jgi:hypothetical protein
MKKEITKSNFDSKKFLKYLRKKFLHHAHLSRFLITKRSGETDALTDKIIDILRKTFEKASTFKSGFFFYIISMVEMFFEFSEKFRENVSTKNDKTLISDAQNTYIEVMNKLLSNLNENYTEPKYIPQEESNQIKEEIENGK